MYAIIVGAGKVGRNLARELIVKGHEVTLIESSRPRYLAIEEEFEHAVAVRRRDRAVGARARRHPARRPRDRGDRRRRGQHARLPGRQGEVPLRPHHRARQQPPQPRPLQAARDPAGGLGDRPDPAPDRARGARATGSCTCSRSKRSAWRSSSSRSAPTRPTVGERVADIALPEGSLIISVLRGGSGFVPKPDTVIEAGDEVLLVLDPGLEESITAYFAPDGSPAQA